MKAGGRYYIVGGQRVRESEVAAARRAQEAKEVNKQSSTSEDSGKTKTTQRGKQS